MSCKTCCKPVDLTVDLYADQNGEAVYEVLPHSTDYHGPNSTIHRLRWTD
jgi:hypothetical protein